MAEPDSGIESVRQEIMDLLQAETLPGGQISGVTIFRGSITDGERIPTDTAGRMVPYGAVVFGGRGPVSSRQKGIGSAKNDLRRFVFGVELFALNSNELDRFADRIEDILVGYEPTNAGEIDSFNSGRIENPAEVKQNWSKEGIGLLFGCYVGTVTPLLV